MYGEELIGTKFGQLTVVRTSERRSKARQAYVWCRCDCGKEKEVRVNNLKVGNVVGCGCWKKEAAKDLFTTHGMYRTPEYCSWLSMKRRCTNSNHKNFKYYGGRGITMCPEWMESFEAFFAHVGPRPEPKRLYSIDRINPDGNYEPGNVRWATRKEQANNRRDNK